jgi:LmbE family N-acetylglucosaminyl deacetylase
MPLPSLESLAHARVLFVFAHPDDESVGLGGILDQFRNAWFACLTDGAPRDASYARAAGCDTPTNYARMRRRELAIALALAGHDSERLIALGFTDQELAHSLEGITQAIEVLLQRVRPDCVVTHPYEGGHPDHDATAFAVHTALAAHAGDYGEPLLLETTSYHAQGDALVWGEFLPNTEDASLALELSPTQRAQKRRLLAAHASQAPALRDVPLDRDLLRVAPRYDFSQPPHDGRLFYENLSWDITGEQWRHAAALALERLHLSALTAAAY